MTAEFLVTKTGRVHVRNETSLPFTDGWRLCLQWVQYAYNTGEYEDGYRFIWRRPDGSLQAARGQARIPSLEVARQLMAAAEAAGWGDHDAG